MVIGRKWRHGESSRGIEENKDSGLGQRRNRFRMIPHIQLRARYVAGQSPPSTPLLQHVRTVSSVAQGASIDDIDDRIALRIMNEPRTKSRVFWRAESLGISGPSYIHPAIYIFHNVCFASASFLCLSDLFICSGCQRPSPGYLCDVSVYTTSGFFRFIALKLALLDVDEHLGYYGLGYPS